MTATALAALAALCVGLAAAAQHHATRQVDQHAVLHPGFVLALLRRRWWVLGSAVAVAGLVLQVAALATGSIITVQTLMVTALAWTTAGESLLVRRRPDGPAVAGVALTVCGIASLLLLLDPRSAPEPRPPTGPAVAVVVGGCALAAGVGLAWAARRTGSERALGLALATGCAYGLTAALLKLVGSQLLLGWDEPLRHPALYAACLLGPAAVLLSQNTFQQGRRASPGVAVVLLVDPAVGLGCGVLWFGERVATTPTTLLAAAACVVVTIGGIALTQRAATVPPPTTATARSPAPGSDRRSPREGPATGAAGVQDARRAPGRGRGAQRG